MPDWLKLVRGRLSGLALEAAEKDEVHTELAAHLQESYESLCIQGVPEHAALKKTLAEVTDWNKLQRQIQITRKRGNTMTPRTGRLLLPSFVTLLVAMTMIPVLESLGLNPVFFFLRRSHGHEQAFPVYTAWLIMLPFVGALGAYLSRRAGGSREAIIVSGTFPALAFFTILLLVIPYVEILEHGLEPSARSVFHSLTSAPFGHLGVIAGWALVPGVCLLIGVLAYLFVSKRLSQRSIASH
ncbi:MAG TPA: hypothetical protein VJN89_16345 [Candidatus Acidoferrum sp.]|nr:hypothetical protein [Candidatus Acidoferrum sp.]